MGQCLIVYDLSSEETRKFLQAYSWLEYSDIHGKVSIDNNHPNKPYSFSGDWHFGIWVGDSKLYFNDSNWDRGVFQSGNFCRSNFRDGKFHGQLFYKSTFESGKFYNGRFSDSVFKEGIFLGGEFENSTWRGGTWVGGTWKSGKIYSHKYCELFFSVVNPAEFKKIEKYSWTRDQLAFKSRTLVVTDKCNMLKRMNKSPYETSTAGKYILLFQVLCLAALQYGLLILFCLAGTALMFWLAWRYMGI